MNAKKVRTADGVARNSEGLFIGFNLPPPTEKGRSEDKDEKMTVNRIALEAAWKIGLPFGLLLALLMWIMWILSR